MLVGITSTHFFVMNFFVFALVSVVIGFWLGHITSFLQKRSYELERQDYSPKDGNYTLIEFEDMMKGLTDLNRIDPAGYNATLALFQKLSFTPKSILEIGKIL